MVSSRVQVLLMFAVSITINGAFLLGVASRPSIRYHLATPLDYNQTIDFSRENLNVFLRTKNQGFTPAQIWLTIGFYNMTLESPEGVEVSNIGNASIARVSQLSTPGKDDYDSFEVAFSAEIDASYAVLIFSINGDPGAGLLYRFTNSFTAFTRERPTAILLKNLGNGTFMRVRSL